MEITNAGDLSYPAIKADLERCNKQLHALCAGTHDGTAVMSVPPQPTDFDMQFSAAFDELAAYRAIGTVVHIQQLAEADNDGRCVVLPCKVGDMVYVHKWAQRTDSDGTVWDILDRKRATVSEKPFTLAMFFISKLGEGYWLTREAAEAALEATHGV